MYGEVCRRYPGRVHHVFLRDVTSHLSEDVVQDLNRKEEKKQSGVFIDGPDRYATAFRGVPPETWSVFDDAATLKQEL